MLHAGAACGAPQVRWYDARARTALRRVAAWLNVPWSKARLRAHQHNLTRGPCSLTLAVPGIVLRPPVAEISSIHACQLGVLQ